MKFTQLSTMLLLTACCLILSSQSFAGIKEIEEYGIYVTGKAGVSIVHIDDVVNTTPTPFPLVPATPSLLSEDDAVIPFGLAMGYYLKGPSSALRAEIEYLYRNDFDYDANPTFRNAILPTRLESTVDIHTALFNIYVDILTGTTFTPYITGGIGAAWTTAEGTLTIIATGTTLPIDETESDFSWHIGGGCAINITKRVLLDISYRYAGLGKVVWLNRQTTVSITSEDVMASEFIAGLRIHF